MNPNPAAPPPQKKGLSPIVWVLIGCGGLALVIFLILGGLALFAVRGVQKMADGIADPATKAENVKELLGVVPEGYHPAFTFGVPLIMDVAMLTDVPFVLDGGPTEFERSFVYFRVMRTESNKKAKDFFDGKTSNTDELRRTGINVEAKDILKRGEVKTSSGATVKYVATRGSLMTSNGREQHALEGLNTLMYFECPGDDALRIGMWTQKEEQGAVADTTGTVADEAQVSSFVGPIKPCG